MRPSIPAYWSILLITTGYDDINDDDDDDANTKQIMKSQRFLYKSQHSHTHKLKVIHQSNVRQFCSRNNTQKINSNSNSKKRRVFFISASAMCVCMVSPDLPSYRLAQVHRLHLAEAMRGLERKRAKSISSISSIFH